MINIGDEITITIKNLTSSGTGVGFFKADTNRAVFVPLTVPGDIIKVKITNQSKVYFEAELIEIIKPSPSRITPPCQHFGKCGACDWLHVSYKEQLKQKKQLLQYAFNKQQIQIKKINIVPSTQEFNYRCKIRFPGNGLSAKKSNEIIPIKECYVLHKKFHSLLSKDHEKGECWGLDEPTQTLTQDEAHYFVDDFILSYHPSGFVQSNFGTNKLLVNHVKSFIGKGKILELYAGNGNFTIPILEKTKKVLAVEGNRKSHQLLIKNLEANEMECQTLHQDVQLFLKDCSIKYSTIILDPPRSGVGIQIKKIGKLTKNIIYISCNAETLAKEIKQLLSQGFVIDDITLFDLFPQTKHFETVVKLKK